MLMQSLMQVEALVKTSSFTHVVQDVFKQLTYLTKAMYEAKQTAMDKLTSQDVVETMNWIETGVVPGIYWTDFPELDHVYSRAIAAIESATQVGSQFSKESIVTINSLMTGMTSVIRTYDKVMMQPFRTVDMSIQNINKRS